MSTHTEKLERDAGYLMSVAEVYLKKYPPGTAPEVLAAVTVPLPLPTFLSLLVVAYQLKEVPNA